MSTQRNYSKKKKKRAEIRKKMIKTALQSGIVGYQVTQYGLCHGLFVPSPQCNLTPLCITITQMARCVCKNTCNISSKLE